MSGRLAFRRKGDFVVRLSAAAAFLLVWQIGATLAHSRLLPTFTAVVRAMVRETLSGALPWNLAITLGRVAAAFVVSLVLGGALGIAMGRWRWLDLLLDNAVTVLMNLPALVIIVLAYIWVGLNEVAAVGAVALNKIPNAIVVLREGARALDPQLDEMADVFRF